MSVCITKKNLIIEDGERPTILLKLDENPNKAVGHVSPYCDLVFRFTKFKKLLIGFVNTFSLETYIAENINEDIYLSVDTDMTKVVKVICPDGGLPMKAKKLFLSREICTNELRQVLIADEKSVGSTTLTSMVVS